MDVSWEYLCGLIVQFVAFSEWFLFLCLMCSTFLFSSFKLDGRTDGAVDSREKLLEFCFDYCYWSVDPTDPHYASQEEVRNEAQTTSILNANDWFLTPVPRWSTTIFPQLLSPNLMLWRRRSNNDRTLSYNICLHTVLNLKAALLFSFRYYWGSYLWLSKVEIRQNKQCFGKRSSAWSRCRQENQHRGRELQGVNTIFSLWMARLVEYVCDVYLKLLLVCLWVETKVRASPDSRPRVEIIAQRKRWPCKQTTTRGVVYVVLHVFTQMATRGIWYQPPSVAQKSICHSLLFMSRLWLGTEISLCRFDWRVLQGTRRRLPD